MNKNLTRSIAPSTKKKFMRPPIVERADNPTYTDTFYVVLYVIDRIAYCSSITYIFQSSNMYFICSGLHYLNPFMTKNIVGQFLRVVSPLLTGTSFKIGIKMYFGTAGSNSDIRGCLSGIHQCRFLFKSFLVLS